MYRSESVAPREFDGVDVFLKNAGVWMETVREATPKSSISPTAATSKGCFSVCRLSRTTYSRGTILGVILNTASISSNSAQFGQVLYDSKQGALRMITRRSAPEPADTGIWVNAVAPGQRATELSEGWAEATHEVVEAEETLKPLLFGRAGTLADAAGAYLSLASEDAQYTTGELLHVDGGWQIC